MRYRSDDCRHRATAIVLPFPVLRSRNRFGLRERIAVMNWAELARPSGISRAVFHSGQAGDDPAEADFVLIYEDGAEWAAWGVACDVRGFSTWRTGTGVTIGCFATLPEALNVILRST